VAIDYAPGLHGHFLEYIINRYIFEIGCEVDTIFQSSGAVHAINADPHYRANRIAQCRHYSSFKTAMAKDTSHVVFVKHNPKLDFILLTNIYYRCHPDFLNVSDFNFKEVFEAYNKMMAMDIQTPRELRENWYTKLQERHFDMTKDYPDTAVPIFDFDFTCFFSLPKFLQELKNVALFLNSTFKFDQSLSQLWHDFIARNQGYQLYIAGQEILTAIYSRESKPIPNDWKLQAYLNSEITKVFELYDGILFDNDNYPAETSQVYDVIMEHLENFDNRF
jgi:hypothetical protein